MSYLAHKSHTSARFYIAVAMISPIREIYPIATTAVAEATTITISLIVIILLSHESLGFWSLNILTHYLIDSKE